MRILVMALACTLAAGCGGGDDDEAPPPVQGQPTVVGTNNVVPPPVPPAPPGQVMITVAASSNPPGATVTGGGRELGRTPLQTQVPVPAPRPGEVQTFAFLFQLPGYQDLTINASPVNNTISITAALAPLSAVPPQPVGGTDGDDGTAAGEIRVNGQGGGPIFDHHTTTGSAVVEASCIIDQLRVRLNGRHTFYRDLHISLRDPGGNRYSLASGGQANPFRTHTVRRAAGRQAQGRWTLAVEDRLGQDSGNLNGWSMMLRCR